MLVINMKNKNKKFDRIAAIKRMSREDNKFYGKSGFHKDQRDKRQKRKNTRNYLEEAEEWDEYQ